RFMKPSGIVSGLSAITLVGLRLIGTLEFSTASTALCLLGLAGTAGVVITSRFFNVRTNRVMADWSLDAIPEDYPEIRRRWDLVHTIRASCGVLAFSSYAIAALVRCAGPG